MHQLPSKIYSPAGIYRAAFGHQLATTYGGQASTDGQPETSRNEKTRRGGTAAGFVPKPCQTLATKSAERYLRNALNSLLDLYSPPRNEKTPGSGTAAGFVPKPLQTLATKIPNITYGMHSIACLIYTLYIKNNSLSLACWSLSHQLNA